MPDIYVSKLSWITETQKLKRSFWCHCYRTVLEEDIQQNFHHNLPGHTASKNKLTPLLEGKGMGYFIAKPKPLKKPNELKGFLKSKILMVWSQTRNLGLPSALFQQQFCHHLCHSQDLLQKEHCHTWGTDGHQQCCGSSRIYYRVNW